MDRFYYCYKYYYTTTVADAAILLLPLLRLWSRTLRLTLCCRETEWACGWYPRCVYPCRILVYVRYFLFCGRFILYTIFVQFGYPMFTEDKPWPRGCVSFGFDYRYMLNKTPKGYIYKVYHLYATEDKYADAPPTHFYLRNKKSFIAKNLLPSYITYLWKIMFWIYHSLRSRYSRVISVTVSFRTCK